MTSDTKGNDMSEFKVERGVPMTGRKSYPFAKMEVGDSFFVPGGATKYGAGDTAAVNSARSHGRRHNRKYVTRTVTEHGVKGLRIWRVE